MIVCSIDVSFINLYIASTFYITIITAGTIYEYIQELRQMYEKQFQSFLCVQWRIEVLTFCNYIYIRKSYTFECISLQRSATPSKWRQPRGGMGSLWSSCIYDVRCFVILNDCGPLSTSPLIYSLLLIQRSFR